MCFRYRTMREWSQKNINNTKPRRDLIHLCVIDDEGFVKEDLNSLNFNDIRVLEKFSNLNDFENYNVILCDIKGIGQNLDNKLQGIAVAREIKKNFPEKIVLQYSGQVVHEYDEKFYDNMIIDGFIEKSKSTKELADDLDKYCSILWDPKAAWLHIEKSLRQKNIDNINIAYFENLYVKSLEKKKDYLTARQKDTRIEKIISISFGLFKLAVSIITLFM